MAEPIYIESSRRWSFACSIVWPGWTRHAKGDADPVAELIAVGPRYRDVISGSGLDFQAPARTDDLEIVERLAGNSGTEWGVPSVVPAADARPLYEEATERLATILAASWRAFDSSVAEAEGHQLRKGPRGDGRNLDGIVGHCLEGDVAYLSKLGARKPKVEGDDWRVLERAIRERALEALRDRAAGRPVREPSRTKELWLPRFYVRYVAWHTLVHAWEIEDRRLD